MERWKGVLDEDPYFNPHFSRGSGDFNLRADLLRPRVLRQERTPEDPASSPDGLLPTSSEERKEFMKILQSVLTGSRKEREKLTEIYLRTARDSYRTTIVPIREDKSARIAALEDLLMLLGNPSPRGDE